MTPRSRSLPLLDLCAQRADTTWAWRVGVFLAVAVAAVDDQRGGELRFLPALPRQPAVRPPPGNWGHSVRRLAAQYQIAVRIALGTSGLPGCPPWSARGTSGRVLRTANGVEWRRRSRRPVPFLKPDRHGQAGGELAVDLAFHRPGAYGAKADQLGIVLAKGGIQEFTGGGQAQRCVTSSIKPGGRGAGPC